MKKLIAASTIILFFIIILIIVISKALFNKPIQVLNKASFPTKMPNSVSSLKNQKQVSSVSSSPQNKQQGSPNQQSGAQNVNNSIKTPNTTESTTKSNSSINNLSTQQSSQETSNGKSQLDHQSSSSLLSQLSQSGATNILTPSNPNLVSQKNKEDMIYLNNFMPFENDDFSIEYSTILNKYIVTIKREGGEKAFTDWANENGVLETLQNPNNAIVSNKTMEEIYASLPPELRSTTELNQEDQASQDAKKQISLLLSLFNVFFSVPESINDMDFELPTPTPSIYPLPSIFLSSSSSSSFPSSANPSSIPQPPTGAGYVYYSQCDPAYKSYPLTSSSTICSCGCGPTSVSMILASYLQNGITPPQVVDMYKSQGIARCGTTLSSAKKILGQMGVNVSDYIVPYNATGYKIEQVADDMKPYIRSGWTIFVLASFSTSTALNHFFWITNIDDANNVYAYDPYYGTGKIPPINENARYPWPKYLAAFGVRK